MAHAKQQTEEEKEEGKVNVWHMQNNRRRKRRKKKKKTYGAFKATGGGR